MYLLKKNIWHSTKLQLLNQNKLTSKTKALTPWAIKVSPFISEGNHCPQVYHNTFWLNLPQFGHNFCHFLKCLFKCTLSTLLLHFLVLPKLLFLLAFSQVVNLLLRSMIMFCKMNHWLENCKSKAFEFLESMHFFTLVSWKLIIGIFILFKFVGFLLSVSLQ